mmetsp:Transcript_41805/g.48294  ORF Transcript_41805/g.48294 Transcript_41805/m.48294 type:complete len:242 (-) Transcript_41805:5534-6259(-)
MSAILASMPLSISATLSSYLWLISFSFSSSSLSFCLPSSLRFLRSSSFLRRFFSWDSASPSIISLALLKESSNFSISWRFSSSLRPSFFRLSSYSLHFLSFSFLIMRMASTSLSSSSSSSSSFSSMRSSPMRSSSRSSGSTSLDSSSSSSPSSIMSSLSCWCSSLSVSPSPSVPWFSLWSVLSPRAFSSTSSPSLKRRSSKNSRKTISMSLVVSVCWRLSTSLFSFSISALRGSSSPTSLM